MELKLEKNMKIKVLDFDGFINSMRTDLDDFIYKESREVTRFIKIRKFGITIYKKNEN
jgi:hypothetical protein